jgi:uncharacterized membrane protein
MSRYAKRLDRDLVRWREAGWVTPDGEAAIRSDVASHSSKLDLASALGILGAVLIGFGAMSFVAAHWSEMPRLFRLAMIFGGLFGAYGIAGVLFDRKHPTFAHAAILLGVALFGAGIMLIAQMFHIEGHPPDAVLTWALGALAAGVILKSNPALALSMLLICVWSGWETTDGGGDVHWAFLLGWGAVTAAIGWQRWGAGLHLAAVALSIWIISLGYLLFDGHAHGVVVGIGLLIAAAGVAAPMADERLDAWSTPAIAYGMTIAFAGLFALQFIESMPLDYFILLAVLSLALVLGGIGLGLKLGSPVLLWLGYAGFSIEVLGIYFKTVGTMLGSSLFFLSAGVLVILLSVIAYRLHARVQPGTEAAP